MKKMFTVGIITILTTITLTGCNWFQSEEPDTEQPTPDTSSEITTDTAEDEPEIAYTPSEKLSSQLNQAQDDLRMSLMRGDAESAPTYEEFITNVNKAQDILEEAIELYKKETKGKEVSADISDIFVDLESINDELSMSLMRGEADLAPTQEEFRKTVSGINDELTTAMDTFRAL